MTAAILAPRGVVVRSAPLRTGATAVRTGARVRRPVPAEVYRRRRMMVAGVILLMVAVVLILVQLARAGVGGGPLTPTGAAALGGDRVQAAASSQYVVRPGDTLWSIASRLDPGGDVRPLMERLAAETGSTDVYPGETIALPPGH